MFTELLPIGSIVYLKEGIRKLMIIGYKVAKKDNPDLFYDYIGVLYPEGFASEHGYLLFNHNDINDLVFTGYNNSERQDFLKLLDEDFNYKKINL